MLSESLIKNTFLTGKSHVACLKSQKIWLGVLLRNMADENKYLADHRNFLIENHTFTL